MKHPIALHAEVAGSLALPLFATAAAPAIAVYKSALCECCTEWVKHLEVNGFTVKTLNVANPSDYRENLAYRKPRVSAIPLRYKIMSSRAMFPASDIKRLLAECPKAKGLAVPSMPMGSPGMEGHRSAPYDVLLVETGGNYSTYHHYNGH